MGFWALIIVGWAAGTALVGRCSFRAETLLFRMLAGLCVCAMGVILVGSVSLFAARIVVGLAAGASLLVAIVRARRRQDDRVPFADHLPNDLTRFESACMGVILAALGLSLLSALAPVTSWDAGAAHLAVPSDYAREGRIALDEGNVYSAYPQLLHSLFAYVYAESGERSTAVLSWFFGVLGCLGVYALGRRVENREVGCVAAAMFATAPILFSQAGTVSIDVAFTAFVVAGLVGLFAWREERALRWLVLGGVLIGASCGIRHTGYLVGALTLTGVIVASHADGLRSAAGYGAGLVAGAGPWLLRSWIVVGNPAYPFLRGVFGNDRLADMQTTTLLGHETTMNLNLWELLVFPWAIVLRPDWYDGWTASPGALVLLLGVPGVIIGGAKARSIGAFAGSGVVCFFFFQQLARYLLPFFTPMMVVAALAADRMRVLRKPIRVLLVFSFAYGLLLGTAMMHFKIPVVFGLELPSKYLERRVERYEAFAWANRNLAGMGTVLTLDPRSYFLDLPTYQNVEILRMLRTLSLEDQLAWMRERNIRYIFYPESYVAESPLFTVHDLMGMLDGWREDDAHFQLAHAMELPRPGGAGVERVEIYEVLWEGVREVHVGP